MPGNVARKAAATGIIPQVPMKALKQPLDLVEQLPVLESEGNQKNRKRDTLPSEFFQYASHCTRHMRKAITPINRLVRLSAA